jgi:hypothetical protein
MSYAIIDLGVGKTPLAMNNLGAVVGNFANSPYALWVRRPDGTFFNLPPEFSTGIPTNISDNGLVLCLQAAGQYGLFNIATSNCQTINLPDNVPIAQCNIDREGNVIGVVNNSPNGGGVQSFILNPFKWINPSLANPVPSPYPHGGPYVYMLGRNTKGHGVGVQVWPIGGPLGEIADVPVYYDGNTIIQIEPVGGAGCCSFITENDLMTVGWNNGGINAIYNATTKTFKTYPITEYIQALNQKGDILWQNGLFEEQYGVISYLTNAAGTTTPIAQLIPPPSGWSQINAVAMNDSVQIAGSGVLDDMLHGFLLTPKSINRPPIGEFRGPPPVFVEGPISPGPGVPVEI